MLIDLYKSIPVYRSFRKFRQLNLVCAELFILFSLKPLQWRPTPYYLNTNELPLYMQNNVPIKNKFRPGLNRWGFLTPPVAGALFLAALVASCFLGAFPPVDLRAVCFVRAIFQTHGNNRRIFAWGKNQTDTFGRNNFLGRSRCMRENRCKFSKYALGSKRELSYGGVSAVDRTLGEHNQVILGFDWL